MPALVMSVALALAGCGSLLDGQGGTKAGPQSVPITLRLGTVEAGDPPYKPLVDEFARQVERRTDGAVRVSIAWEVIPWTPDSEVRLAQLVDKGDIDFALVPSRAFQTLGSSAVDSLITPFLVDSPALADAATSGHSGAAMLADLPTHGSVGLALVPEELRHPAGYHRAIVTPADFTGLRIRAVQTKTATADSWELFTLFGAVPSSPFAYSDALLKGDLQAAETGYQWFHDYPPGMVYTANLTFFPKVDTLIAAKRSLARLTQDERDAVRDAAGAARSYALAHQPTEAEELAAVCDYGDRAVLASRSAIAQLVALAGPVRADLESHPDVAAAMAGIARLKAGLSTPKSAVPHECDPPTGDSATLPGG